MDGQKVGGGAVIVSVNPSAKRNQTLNSLLLGGMERVSGERILIQ